MDSLHWAICDALGVEVEGGPDFDFLFATRTIESRRNFIPFPVFLDRELLIRSKHASASAKVQMAVVVVAQLFLGFSRHDNLTLRCAH